MLKPPPLSKWSQKGRLYLWKYERKFPKWGGVHMTLDAPGGESMAALIAFMQAMDVACKRTLTVSRPTADILSIPNYQRSTRTHGPDRFVLKYDPGAAPDAWTLAQSGHEYLLEAGPDALKELADGVRDIREGKGDYNIGPYGDHITLWWHPKQH